MAPPAVDLIDQLLTLAGPTVDANGVRLGTAAGLAGARIFDGPPLARYEEPDAVAFGLAIEDVAGAVGTVTPGWGDDRLESFDVTGLTESWLGDTGMSVARARAFSLLDGVRRLVDADPTVGGLVMRARLARWTYRPEQSPDGAAAVIEFAIRVDARRFEGA